MIADWNVSGRAKYTAGRPGYQRLLRAIGTGASIRLSRDVVDTSKASGQMVAGILARVAEFEAEVTRKRVIGSFVTRR